MSSKVQALVLKGLASPPPWMPSNVHYEAIMGSQAYGVAESDSDMDVYGFAIPPKTMIFPHLAGEIEGFGERVPRFEVWQQHHIKDVDALGGRGREYDFQIFGIVKFFQLAMQNNPNMVDALFVPGNCLLHCTRLGQRVRDQRRLFLHKGSYHRFRGYAHAQLHKMRGDRERPEGKRQELVEKHGFDVKFAYHVVRLLDEAEQILETGDLVLGRNREILKEIRRGEWTECRVREYFSAREDHLSRLYRDSKLPHGPDEGALRSLLMECLEEHFGSLAAAVVTPGAAERALREIAATVEKYNLANSAVPA